MDPLPIILSRVNAAINSRAEELLSNDLDARELLGRRKMLQEIMSATTTTERSRSVGKKKCKPKGR